MKSLAVSQRPAALSLQSVLLQTLVHKGVLTASEALDVADKAIAAARIDPQEYAEAEVAEVTATCLEHIREGWWGWRLSDIPMPSLIGRHFLKLLCGLCD